jgi:hypothetical protein
MNDVSFIWPPLEAAVSIFKVIFYEKDFFGKEGCH